jgi:hypothetical protein
MYGKYRYPHEGEKKYVTAYGRCIGNGGMPVELNSSHAVDPKNLSCR